MFKDKKNVTYKAIKDNFDSFAYKDGYKVTIKTDDINYGVTLFFALTQNYESNTAIYMHLSPQEAILEVLSMQKVSHFTRIYNKIL